MTFDDVLPAATGTLQSFTYFGQDSVYRDTTIVRSAGQSLTIDLGFDKGVASNKYEWFKNGVAYQTLTGTNKINFNALNVSDGGVYHVFVSQ